MLFQLVLVGRGGRGAPSLPISTNLYQLDGEFTAGSSKRSQSVGTILRPNCPWREDHGQVGAWGPSLGTTGCER